MRTSKGVVIEKRRGFCRVRLDTGSIINLIRSDLVYGQVLTIGLDLTGEGMHTVIEEKDPIMCDDELMECAEWEDEVFMEDDY